MLRAFLSSPFQDLVNERKATESTILRMAARYIGMEHFGSVPGEPVEVCRRKLRSADVLILLLGFNYGHVPELMSVSITEIEYREARRCGIPILAYLADASAYSAPSSVDERLTKLRAEIQETLVCSWFLSPEDLAWKVATDLGREFASHMAHDAPPLESLSNEILMEPLRDRINELTLILEDRAKAIRASLSQKYLSGTRDDRLAEFNVLHKEHIKSLRQGNILRAHELLVSIHALLEQGIKDSTTLAGNQPVFLRYSANQTAVRRRSLTDTYIGADKLRVWPSKYSGYNASRQRNLRTEDAIGVYKRLLGGN